MAKKCAICSVELSEDCGKLAGKMLKIVENKKKSWIYVCSTCQKKDKNHIETAKIKAA